MQQLSGSDERLGAAYEFPPAAAVPGNAGLVTMLATMFSLYYCRAAA
jgi:hypothetical protein